ncbi:MAG: hypothetical protein HQL32_04835, partial [Planctomycetes bacterium]|nr:hypothetical protein [Planctomycetota bacterium]
MFILQLPLREGLKASLRLMKEFSFTWFMTLFLSSAFAFFICPEDLSVHEDAQKVA